MKCNYFLSTLLQNASKYLRMQKYISRDNYDTRSTGSVAGAGAGIKPCNRIQHYLDVPTATFMISRTKSRGE
jgi:hypothetical protein